MAAPLPILLVFDHFRTGLVFVLCENTILGFQNRASTRLMAQTFKIRLDNQSRVGTPLRQNLIETRRGTMLYWDKRLLPITVLPRDL